MGRCTCRCRPCARALNFARRQQVQQKGVWPLVCLALVQWILFVSKHRMPQFSCTVPDLVDHAASLSSRAQTHRWLCGHPGSVRTCRQSVRVQCAAGQGYALISMLLACLSPLEACKACTPELPGQDGSHISVKATAAQWSRQPGRVHAVAVQHGGPAADRLSRVAVGLKRCR